MTKLSSAEQVRSAYVTAYANSRFPGHDVRFPMSPPERYGLVAALRAVADQLGYYTGIDEGLTCSVIDVDDLLSLAAELEGLDD